MEGRPIEKDQWMAFTEATCIMSGDINRYRFAWSGDDESDAALDNRINEDSIRQEQMPY
jgi:hypothetical protein